MWWDFDPFSQGLLGQQALGRGLVCLDITQKVRREGPLPMCSLGWLGGEEMTAVGDLHPWAKRLDEGSWAHGDARFVLHL